MKYAICLIFMLILLPLVGCAAAPERDNAQLHAYYDGGYYNREIAHVYGEALKSVMTTRKSFSKPAVVLDIDETVLSNWNELSANGFKQNPQKVGGGDAIAPAYKFYDEVKEHGVAVFFLTGRPELMRHAMEQNLKQAGFENWDGLILRPNGYNAPNGDYKTPMRSQITAKGYTILATIGDQKSDLYGNHTGRAFKLPNPFYSVQ